MRFSNILWGLVFIFLGLIIGLNALEITNINLFFNGWWTFFLIIPGFVGLFTEKDKLFNLIVLIVGISLLLGVRGIIDFSLLWKLMLPIILVVIGISILFKDALRGKLRKERKPVGKGDIKEYMATFAGETLDFKDDDVENLNLSAVFGSIKCDLRDAKFQKENFLKVEAIFGGIDIIVPNDVLVKVQSTSIFGGVSNKKKVPADSKKILYLDATCLFGGVDIK